MFIFYLKNDGNAHICYYPQGSSKMLIISDFARLQFALPRTSPFHFLLFPDPELAVSGSLRGQG